MNGQIVGAVPLAHVGAETAEFGHTTRLPAELLGEIFAILHLPDRMRTATVCRRWRSASLDAAGQLRWTVIGPGPIITPQGLDACKASLDRSRGTLATFVIRDMYYGNFEQLAEMAVEYLSHIKELDVTLWPHPFLYEDVPQKVASCVSSMLQTDAPVLERLRVVNHARHAINGVSILRAPALSALQLRGVELSCLSKCAGSPALRTLTVDTQATRWSWNSPWSLICPFPSLETLGVGFVNLDIPSDVSYERLPLPGPGAVAPRGNAHAAHRPRGVRAAARVAPGVSQRRIPPSGAAAGSSALPAAHPALRGGHRAVRRQRDAPHGNCGRRAQRHSSRPSCRRRLDRPARGCADALCRWAGLAPKTCRSARAPFPALEELTLDVTPESTAYTLTTFKWPHIECPVLRAVTLRSAGAIRKLPLAAITSLLQDALDGGPGKLAALTLHGVHVSAPQSVDAVAALHEMAETVTIHEAGSVWPECHLAWNRPWDELVR